MTTQGFAMASLTAGQLNALVKKHGGPDGVKRFLSGKPEVSSQPKLKLLRTWRRLKLGKRLFGPNNARGFRNALRAANVGIMDTASLMLTSSAFTVSSENFEIELVDISRGDFIFSNSEDINYIELCKRALSVGLSLCPSEVGPRLCLEYPEEMEAIEGITIAMEPIVIEGQSYLFNPKQETVRIRHDLGDPGTGTAIQTGYLGCRQIEKNLNNWDHFIFAVRDSLKICSDSESSGVSDNKSSCLRSMIRRVINI